MRVADASGNVRGSIFLKHPLKWMAGCAAVAERRFTLQRSTPQVVVLMYHRVADLGCFDSSVDAWNVTPHRFERHISWLSRNAECLTLDRIEERLFRPAADKPPVAITFDDGFANFATRAFPILAKYRVPATVFLPTRYMDSNQPYPFDRWGQRNFQRTDRESWHPLTWDQVHQCAKSRLVTFGSHSDSHPHPATCTAEELLHETIQSRDVLQHRLGEPHAFAYAYPYGSIRQGDVGRDHIEAVRRAGFTQGYVSEPGSIQPGARLFMLPRVEVHGWDGLAILAAKVHGNLSSFKFAGKLRRMKRSPNKSQLDKLEEDAWMQ